MARTLRKTDDVFAAARRDLKTQLAAVREEQRRLAAEERALTDAIASLNGGGTTASAGPAAARTRSSGTRSARKATRRRRPRGASKSTAERVKELEALLAAGPQSRSDLAVALKVSPARVQQLLSALGSSVTSAPATGRRGKLWTLSAGGDGGPAAKSKAKRSSAKAKAGSARKKPARQKAARGS